MDDGLADERELQRGLDWGVGRPWLREPQLGRGYKGTRGGRKTVRWLARRSESVMTPWALHWHSWSPARVSMALASRPSGEARSLA